MEIFAFCVIIHEPIKIQTCSAPQNDRLNFVFMKDIYVDSKKVARNSSKTAIQLSQILRTTLQVHFDTSIVFSIKNYDFLTKVNAIFDLDDYSLLQCKNSKGTSFSFSYKILVFSSGQVICIKCLKIENCFQIFLENRAKLGIALIETALSR